MAVCRVGQAAAPADHLFDLVGLRFAGPTLRIHKLAAVLRTQGFDCGSWRIVDNLNASTLDPGSGSWHF